MPLTRITMRRGKPSSYRATVVEELFAALRESFEVPEGDLFVTVSQQDDDELYYDRSYLGIARDDDFIIFQIVANDTRSSECKGRFYRALVERLADRPGIAPGNVFVNLIETRKENWSFGNGIAQYAEPPSTTGG